jgi:hypothetical protein
MKTSHLRLFTYSNNKERGKTKFHEIGHTKRVSVQDTYTRKGTKQRVEERVKEKTLRESSENMTQTFHLGKKENHTYKIHTE